MLFSISTCWQRPQKPPVQQNHESRMYFWRPLEKHVIFSRVTHRKNMPQIPYLLFPHSHTIFSTQIALLNGVFLDGQLFEAAHITMQFKKNNKIAHLTLKNKGPDRYCKFRLWCICTAIHNIQVAAYCTVQSPYDQILNP